MCCIYIEGNENIHSRSDNIEKQLFKWSIAPTGQRAILFSVICQFQNKEYSNFGLDIGFVLYQLEQSKDFGISIPMLSYLLLTSMNIIRYYKYYITVIQGINHTIPTVSENIFISLSFRKYLWYIFYHFSSHFFLIATLMIFIVIDIVFIIEYFLLFR